MNVLMMAYGPHQQTMGSLDSSGQLWTALDSTTVGTERDLSVRSWTELGVRASVAAARLGWLWLRLCRRFGYPRKPS
jgi:hypothetical protein